MAQGTGNKKYHREFKGLMQFPLDQKITKKSKVISE